MSRLAEFLSTEASFPLPLGGRIGDGEVAGYYIDMRAKAPAPSFPDDLRGTGDVNWDAVAQWALGAWEHHLGEGGDARLAAMRDAGDHLVAHQQSDGGFVHTYLLGHTFPLLPPSLSAMAQGQCASVLVRLHRATGEDAYAQAALRALEPLYVATRDGGTRADLHGGPWLEEYPTDPPSFVLNGGLFAIWGLYDAALGLGDERARSEWEACAETFTRNVHRWDLGWWSRYDLFPHPVLPNVASIAYHALHTNQLRAMQVIRPRPEVARVLARFERYSASRIARASGFAGKSAFRLVVPRNQRLARVWPGPVRAALR